MAEKRRKFSPQFKAEAVQMVVETGRPIVEVARDLGIHDGTLGNWVNAYRREGGLYLSTVIDLATRMVVGWQLADHMRTSLVVDALQMGIEAGLVADGAIFHADRGAQYTSTEFTTFCRDNRMRTSHGRTGVCWDNAAAETFFAALKNEMYHRHTFTTRARARFAVAEYIEIFYNRRRLHSTLGYRTPHEALTEHHQTATAA